MTPDGMGQRHGQWRVERTTRQRNSARKRRRRMAQESARRNRRATSGPLFAASRFAGRAEKSTFAATQWPSAGRQAASAFPIGYASAALREQQNIRRAKRVACPGTAVPPRLEELGGHLCGVVLSRLGTCSSRARRFTPTTKSPAFSGGLVRLRRTDPHFSPKGE